MRIGILTGGGDAPGLNGVIESATKTLINLGHEVVGICDGFEGIFEHKTKLLTKEIVEGAHCYAGTLLGTTNRCGTEGRENEFLEKYKMLKLDGLIAAGGDGTFKGLTAFKDSIPLIGVPKTIDNDLNGTEVTFGFDTACSVVAQNTDSLRTTARAHQRVILVETMGRTAGWIALGGGMACYADAILIPERPFDPQGLLQHIEKRYKAGVRGQVIVVSEGARSLNGDVHVAFTDDKAPEAQRYGGVAEHLARWVSRESSMEGRHVVLGHLQRSHSPTTTDRFLTLAMGVAVGKLAHKKMWGMGAAYNNGVVAPIPIEQFMKPAKLVDESHRWVQMAKSVGIFI